MKTKPRANKHLVTQVTPTLLEEIKTALTNIRGWGSVEIYVQKGRVTQITERNIKKTDHEINRNVSA